MSSGCVYRTSCRPPVCISPGSDVFLDKDWFSHEEIVPKGYAFPEKESTLEII